MLWHPWPRSDPLRALRAHPVLDLPAPVENDRIRGAVKSMRIVMAGKTAVLETVDISGDTHVYRLADGRAFIADPIQLNRNARSYKSSSPGQTAHFEGLRFFDQWIINTGRHLNGLYRYALHDDDDTLLWLSPGTGDVLQAVTRQERIWCWIGAIPHWLYPSLLRRHPALWSGILIVLSGTGIFLTATGLWIGLRRAGTVQRLSPYRGVHRIHHLAGLGFGFFALSWIVTGFLTMNPAGLLARQTPPAWTGMLSGRFDSVILCSLMPDLIALSHRTPLRAIRILPTGNTPFVILTHDDGRIKRRTLSLASAPLDVAELDRASRHIGYPVTIRRLDEADSYYFSTRHIMRHFPVLRLTGADGTRLYLDDRSREPLLTVDSLARGARWIIYGPHDLDFSAVLRAPLARILLLVPLLCGVALIFLAGAWIGLQRLIRRSKPVQSPPRLQSRNDMI